MTLLKTLSVVGLIAAVSWLIFEPSFESIVTTLGALTALVSLFVVSRRKKVLSSQSQSVSGSSTGIQAGGSVHIGTTGKRENDD